MPLNGGCFSWCLALSTPTLLCMLIVLGRKETLFTTPNLFHVLQFSLSDSDRCIRETRKKTNHTYIAGLSYTVLELRCCTTAPVMQPTIISHAEAYKTLGEIQTRCFHPSRWRIPHAGFVCRQSTGQKMGTGSSDRPGPRLHRLPRIDLLGCEHATYTHQC